MILLLWGFVWQNLHSLLANRCTGIADAMWEPEPSFYCARLTMMFSGFLQVILQDLYFLRLEKNNTPNRLPGRRLFLTKR